MPERYSHENYEAKLLGREINYWPLESYKGSRVPILHVCLNDHQWRVSPTNILNGKGCPHCYGNARHSNETYARRLEERGITNYIPVEKYISISTRLKHRCLTCSHEWLVTPNDVLSGKGCPSCSVKGFKTALPAELYFVKFSFNKKDYYKVGITNKTVEERLCLEWEQLNISVVWRIHFERGLDALRMEQKLKKEYDTFRINTGAFKSGGNTETFSISIPKPL